MDTKNPFGLRDGKIVMIEDLYEDEKGLACNCICPACEDKLIARMGNINIHHFSHSGKGCEKENAFLVGIYSLVKEIIDSEKITLPPLTVYWSPYEKPYTKNNYFDRISFSKKYCFQRFINIYPETEITPQKTEIIYKKQKPVALILYLKTKKLALCIKPPDTVCHSVSIKKYEDLATICFDASDIDFNNLKRTDISKKIVSEINNKYWIYSPKALESFDKIYKENEKYIEKQKEDIESLEKNKKTTQKKDIDNSPSQTQQKLDKSSIRLKGYESIKNKDFYQESYIIKDFCGNRWVLCTECGDKYPSDECSAYGMPKLNLGLCRNCEKNNKKPIFYN